MLNGAFSKKVFFFLLLRHQRRRGQDKILNVTLKMFFFLADSLWDVKVFRMDRQIRRTDGWKDRWTD